MPRKSRSTGVGRGNGPGSEKGQFKDGMPSRNPLGRPKKEKPTPPASLQDALARKLGATVRVMMDGKTIEMLQYEAMVEALMIDFGLRSTSPAMRLRILKECISIVPTIASQATLRPDPEALEEVVKMLAEQHDENERKPDFGRR